MKPLAILTATIICGLTLAPLLLLAAIEYTDGAAGFGTGI